MTQPIHVSLLSLPPVRPTTASRAIASPIIALSTRSSHWHQWSTATSVWATQTALVRWERAKWWWAIAMVRAATTVVPAVEEEWIIQLHRSLNWCLWRRNKIDLSSEQNSFMIPARIITHAKYVMNCNKDMILTVWLPMDIQLLFKVCKDLPAKYWCHTFLMSQF